MHMIPALELACPGPFPRLAFGPDTLLYTCGDKVGGALHTLALGSRTAGPVQALPQVPSALAPSPSGEQLALALGRTVQVQGPGSSSLQLTGHRARANVWGLSWLPQRRLLSQGSDALWNLWDVPEGRLLAQASGRRVRSGSVVDGVWTLACRPVVQGQTVAFQLLNGLTGARAGSYKRRLAKGYSLSACQLALRPDTRDLAIVMIQSSGDQTLSTLQLLSDRGAETVLEVAGRVEDRSPPFSELGFVGPDLLWVSGRGHRAFWDLRTGRSGHCGTPLKASAGGRIISRQGELHDLHSGERLDLPKMLLPLVGPDRDADLAEDGRSLAIVQDGTLRVWAVSP